MPKPLPTYETQFFNVTAKKDEKLQELIMGDDVNVVASDYILAVLMASGRSVRFYR